MNMMAMPELSGAAQLIHAQRMLNMRVLLARFERNDMEEAVDMLLAMMDRADGDCDIELNGDEQDGDFAEDEFASFRPEWDMMPGCPIADPDLGVDDSGMGGGDLAYAEWHTLPASTRRAGLVEGRSCDPWQTMLHEDAENDDEPEDDDDDTTADDIGEEEPDTEITAWPERNGRDGIGFGGLAGTDMSEDAEPRYVPASMDPPFAANAA